MNKMKKVAFVLTMLAVLLVACGGGGDEAEVEAETGGPCTAEDPLGYHPDGTEILRRSGDRIGDSVCTNNGWVYEPLPPSEEEESGEEPDEQVASPDPEFQEIVQPQLSTVQVVSTGADECPTASDLGPWAPNNGIGEDFEITANDTISSGVHVQLWWPAGSGEEWGKQEISVFIPSGLSVEAQDAAGRGWEYGLACSLDEIESQMADDNARRMTDTSYFGRVSVDELIATGLVIVRFDLR